MVSLTCVVEATADLELAHECYVQVVHSEDHHSGRGPYDDLGRSTSYAQELGSGVGDPL